MPFESFARKRLTTFVAVAFTLAAALATPLRAQTADTTAAAVPPPAAPADAEAPPAYNAWSPGRQWMSLRAGYAKSTEDSAGHGAAGYGMSYMRFITGVKVWKWTVLRGWGFGASFQHDLVGRERPPLRRLRDRPELPQDLPHRRRLEGHLGRLGVPHRHQHDDHRAPCPGLRHPLAAQGGAERSAEPGVRSRQRQPGYGRQRRHHIRGTPGHALERQGELLVHVLTPRDDAPSHPFARRRPERPPPRAAGVSSFSRASASRRARGTRAAVGDLRPAARRASDGDGGVDRCGGRVAGSPRGPAPCRSRAPAARAPVVTANVRTRAGAFARRLR
jgi:hypothetical protein